MTSRLLAAAAVSALALVGCDQSTPTLPTVPATQAATSTAAAAAPSGANADIASAPRERISLGAIPLSIEAPKGWQLQPGANGKIVLHGRLPSGEVDVLLVTEPSPIKADALRLMVDQITKTPSTDPHTKNEVTQRDGLTIIQSIAPQTPPGVPLSSDPDLVPMAWNIRCVVADAAVDLPVYELAIVNLSQSMYDKDQKFVRELIGSLRSEKPAAK